MNAMELCRGRRSVRTFDGRPLEREDAERILEFAGRTVNPWGLPITWRLLSAEAEGLSSPVILGTDSYLAGKLSGAPHAEEAFGYSFERILLFASSLGVGSTWIAGTMDRPAFEKAMGLETGEVMPCVSPLGYPAKKMSLRESMMRKGIRADSRMDFSELFFDGSFDAPLRPETAPETAQWLELVRWAPSAVNKQPWRVLLKEGKAHFYEKRSKGYVSDDGWDIQKIDLGIALCHFALGAEEQGRRPVFTWEDPGIPVPQDMLYIATCETR